MSPRPRAILQGALPYTPWTDPALSRMPGMKPVEGPWIVVDDAYAAQMAERARLWREGRDGVCAMVPGSEEAIEELLQVVLSGLPADFVRDAERVVRPDGMAVSTKASPFAVLNALLQEDLLLLERRGEEHVLIAGLLCFPSQWTLAEKIGRPLTRIHAPVQTYDDALARRVQRLMDLARPDRAMWRANVLWRGDTTLHRPKREATPHAHEGTPRYLRSERQTIVKLPRTGAVLFAVHTYVVRLRDLTSEQKRSARERFGLAI